MNEKKVLQFYQKLAQDKEMASDYTREVALAIHETVWPKIVSFANDNGFPFSVEELNRFILEQKAKEEEISLEELDAVAGGAHARAPEGLTASFDFQGRMVKAIASSPNSMASCVAAALAMPVSIGEDDGV